MSAVQFPREQAPAVAAALSDRGQRTVRVHTLQRSGRWVNVVTARPGRGNGVQIEGGHAVQHDAVAFGVKLARSLGVELVVHGLELPPVAGTAA